MAEESGLSELEGFVTEETPKQPSQGGIKKWLIYGGIGLIAAIAAGSLVYFILFPKYQEWQTNKLLEEQNIGSTQEEEEVEREEIGQTYTISDLTINPKNSMGRRYAVFEVVLEVKDAGTVEQLKRYHPIIMDRFISYLRQKTMLELADDNYITKIKKDLMGIVNKILGEELVYDLYFTRFVLE